MGQAPGLPSRVHHQWLTAGLDIVLTAFLDLSQIASMGAILYLAMDIAVHWGVIRHLRSDIEANLVIPAIAIALDVVVLGAPRWNLTGNSGLCGVTASVRAAVGRCRSR